MKLVQTLNKVAQTVGKHSPLILTVAGVAGLGATAVFSYKSAKKVEVIVEGVEKRREQETTINELLDHELDKDGIHELSELQESFVPVDRFVVARDLTGAVALPVATGVLSIVAIALSYHIQNNRIVNLAAALATASAERAFYRNKYKDQYGEEQYNKFYTPTKRETHQVTNSKGKKEDLEVETKQDINSLHGQWFDQSTEYTSDDHDYNLAYIREIESKMSLRLFRKGFLRLNEVNEAIGFPRSRSGELVGWSTADNFVLDTEVTQCMNRQTHELEPQIYVKWATPKYIYDTVEYEENVKGMI